MKTFVTTAFAIFLFTVTCHAQWTAGTGTITTTNSVGIGITPPLAKLHVAGAGISIDGGNATNINANGLAIQGNTGGRSSTIGAQLEFVIPANTDGTNFWGQGRIITVAGTAATTDATGKMILGTRRMFNKLGTGSQFYYGNDITIDGGGNVGVGITSPTEKFEVSGGFIKSGFVSIGNNSQVGAKNFINLGADINGSFLAGSNIYVTSQGGSTALRIANSHSTMAGAGIMIPGNGQNFQSSIMFHTSVPGAVVADAPYNSCRMIITEHGNVGIGTTSPDQMLAVNGTVHSKAVVVDNNIFPDYVFKKTYALRPLSAVKAYIDLNHHLPEMPSAAEVAKNGQNLGEVNALLLKKVEELTLYMIEKDKQVKALEEQRDMVHKQKETLQEQQAQINQLKKQVEELVKSKK